MKNNNEIPGITIEITERFYKAVNRLVMQKQIRGLGTLARKWDVSRFALQMSKTHPEDKRLKVEYLYYIARDYRVSLNWLFFGVGDMFEA